MKILVIRRSSIGDIVLTTPVIRCLKQQLHAEVHLLTKRNFLPVLASNKHISRFIGIENDLNAALIEIKKEGYDVIVDLHKNLRTLKLQLRLKQGFVVFNKLNLKKLLLTKAKINLLPQKHLVDRYFDAVKKLGVTNDGLGLDFHIFLDNSIT